jgi:hypothetical protein
MEENAALTIFPKKRVKAFDGMSVTAEAWSQAHEEHRDAQRAHNLSLHGAGIITGLEVLANDPPDQYVFISPGAAVDPAGNVIVLTETVAYDFGSNADGTLFLVLGHGERESGGVETEIKYTHHEYVIAARPSMPKRPVVELARVTLTAGKPIKIAANPSQPRPGELDLRFRSQLAPRGLPTVHVGLLPFGPNAAATISGWNYLSRECQRSGFCNLIVDDELPANDDFSRFDILCLSASGSFKPEAATVKALRAYLETGKTLLAEARDQAADESFSGLFEKLGHIPQPLHADDALLTTPYLFTTPPGGPVLREKQVIYAASGFSPAWSGKMASSRAEIRSAHEWGINLLNACLAKPA